MRAALLLVLCSLVAGEFNYKRLSGPPSEFFQMRTPSPVKGAINEESAFLPVEFEEGATVFTQELAVDSKTVFQLVLYSPEADDFTLKLVQPDGTELPDLDKLRENGQWPMSSTGKMVVAPGWRIESPQRGLWRAELTRKDARPLRAVGEAPPKGRPAAYLFLWNDSQDKIFSHLGTYKWTKDQTVGITAQMYDAAAAAVARGERPEAHARVQIHRAQLRVYLPDGEKKEVEMRDDGQTFDLLAGDSVYGGSFSVPQDGMYRITSLFVGTLEDGTPFMRSAEHAMVTVEDPVEIVKGAAVKADARDAGADQLSVFVPVDGPEQTLLRTYAEVYGTAPDGSQKAACWIGGYSSIQKGQVELEINKRWLATAGVAAPLYLRTVSLYDANRHIPLAFEAQMPVQGDLAAALGKAQPLAAGQEPTEEMLKGKRPAHLTPEFARQARAASAEPLPSLVLLPGYCADDNPWVANNPVVFTDYFAYTGSVGKSLLHNEFAEDVISQTGHLPSWGVLGHSQGGMVSLHIRNFYWSPNDAASSGTAGAEARPVQSVGSPYLGVSGAGAALDLGSLFGVGCGENFDLTMDGSNLWLAGIQKTSRQDVYFYTTKWKDSGLIKYCNLAVNLVLSWPNDGTAEFDQCQLPDAHPQQNPYEGECHTPDMNWPPQTENVDRNAEINAKAAR